MNGLSKKIVALAGIFAALGMPTMALGKDSQVFTKYGISISGIPIGTARVTTRFKNGAYNIVANGRTSGVSRLVSDGKGTLATAGNISSGQVHPSTFSMDTSDKELVTHVRMGLSKGDIHRLIATPPLTSHSDRVPVERRHHRKVFDPLSAFMVPLDDDGRIEPEKACARSIPVFDGWQRFDIKLAFKQQKNVKLGGKDGYRGPVVVCSMAYVPIAGHRPSRKATASLTKNKNMELWLAPVVGLPVLIPVHIKIGTLVGPLTMSTEILAIKGGEKTQAQAN